jgi:hypothetical protein
MCAEARDCVIGALFETGVQRKRPESEVIDILTRCTARARDKALGKTAAPPAAAKRPAPRAGARDSTNIVDSGWVEIKQCVRELKPAALKTLIAQCQKVSLDKDACDPKYPCFHIEKAIREGCATAQNKGAAPSFCAGAPE